MPSLKCLSSLDSPANFGVKDRGEGDTSPALQGPQAESVLGREMSVPSQMLQDPAASCLSGVLALPGGSQRP